MAYYSMTGGPVYSGAAGLGGVGGPLYIDGSLVQHPLTIEHRMDGLGIDVRDRPAYGRSKAQQMADHEREIGVALQFAMSRVHTIIASQRSNNIAVPGQLLKTMVKKARLSRTAKQYLMNLVKRVDVRWEALLDSGKWAQTRLAAWFVPVFQEWVLMLMRKREYIKQKREAMNLANLMAWARSGTRGVGAGPLMATRDGSLGSAPCAGCGDSQGPLMAMRDGSLGEYFTPNQPTGPLMATRDGSLGRSLGAGPLRASNNGSLGLFGGSSDTTLVILSEGVGSEVQSALALWGVGQGISQGGPYVPLAQGFPPSDGWSGPASELTRQVAQRVANLESIDPATLVTEVGGPDGAEFAIPNAQLLNYVAGQLAITTEGFSHDHPRLVAWLTSIEGNPANGKVIYSPNTWQTYAIGAAVIVGVTAAGYFIGKNFIYGKKRKRSSKRRSSR